MSIGDVGARMDAVGWQEVAEAVVNRRVELGMRTRKQLADKTGLTVKTLGEIERAERTSYDPATLAKIEQVLQWPAGAIAVFVEGPSEAAYLQKLHPLAAELGQMLGAGSPLTDQSRAELRALVDRDVDTFRPEMRGDALVIATGGGTTVVSREQGRVKLRQTTGRSMTLDALAALLNPDTGMDDRARAAIRQLVDAAVELGGQAMLLWDAQHGRTNAEVLERAQRPPLPQPSEHRRVPQERS